MDIESNDTKPEETQQNTNRVYNSWDVLHMHHLNK